MSSETTLAAAPRVRFAPSPTGALHLGSAFIALANAAFARANGGAFVLRIDDTDQARSREEDTFELIALLRWMGIEWDEGPIHQRERHAAHRIALDSLVAQGHAYPCFCGDVRLAELRKQQQDAGQPPRYDGRCRELDPDEVQRSLDAGAPHVLRFKVPSGRDVDIDDLVHGRVIVPAGSFGDPILCRADGSMGYLLSSVVDDIDLSISHVIRGEDHLHNTARQILLFEALDARLPVFAHLPLLRESEGRKLSKRDPLGTLDAFVDEGFQPRTVRRYLAELLGQGAIDLLAGEGRISLDRIPTGAPRVDRVRIESLGREDMGDLDDATLFAGAGIDADDRVTPIVRELASACHSFVHLRGEMRLVLDGPGPADLPVILRVVAPDEEQMARFDASLELTAAQLRFELEGGPGAGADDVWAVPFVGRIKADGKEHGLGVRDVLQPLRIALTGTAHGPALDLVLTAVGARDALRRIHIARAVLSDVRGAAAPAGG